ncbi:hypothetical protein ABFS83_05G080800 [Erythranthe nasuta]
MVLAGRAIKIEMKCQNTKENSNQFSALPKPIRSGYWTSEIQEMANEGSTRHSKAGRAIKTKMKFWKFPRSNQDQEWQSVFSIANIFGLLAVHIGLRYSHSEIQEIACRNSQTVVRYCQAHPICFISWQSVYCCQLIIVNANTSIELVSWWMDKAEFIANRCIECRPYQNY